MVTAKLIDRDGKFYIYEYRPEGHEEVGVFATTSDLMETYIISESSFDIDKRYLKKVLLAIKTNLIKRDTMLSDIALQWY